nr:MAG TPA: hypothetical protein [Caudoviricetes sp.]
MAQFKAENIDRLALTAQEIAEIPEDIKRQMLTAGGEVAAEAQRQKIRALGLVSVKPQKKQIGKLVESITVQQKLYVDIHRNREPYVLVHPTGTHGKYRRRVITRAYKRSKHGRTYTIGGDVKETSNNDVGFIHEFGAPRRHISGKMWMAQANAESADAVTTAEFGVYDEWLKSKGL